MSDTQTEVVLTPYGNRVLVQMDKDVDRSVGGIIVKGDTTTCRLGTVLAVGPGEWEDGAFVRPAVEPKQRIVVPRKHMGYAPFPHDPDILMIASQVIVAVVSGEQDNAKVA